MKKKKTAIIISIIIALLILLFPIRMNLKDGGSVSYKSLLYEVTKIHQLNHNVDGVKPYIDGYEIKILGMTVYRKTDGISNSLPIDTDVEPMVMVDGKLYIATGKESTITARCGVMDGEITSSVDGNTIPTQDNQSNFGDGYGYQYGTDGTIEVCIGDKWYVYEVMDNPIIASSVSKIGKSTLSQAIEISDEDAATLTEIVKNGNWVQDNSKCEHDCVITLSGYSLHYHSECGTFEKINLSEVSTYSSKEPSTNSMLILDEQTKDKVNVILEKYIDL